MTRYHVHIYREMRLLFEGIEAATPEDAARIAAERPTGETGVIDDCNGENLAALVDIDGDENYAQSRLIDFEPERLRKAAPAMRDTLLYVAGELGAFKPDYLRQIGLDVALEKVEKALAIADNTATEASAPAAEDEHD